MTAPISINGIELTKRFLNSIDEPKTQTETLDNRLTNKFKNTSFVQAEYPSLNYYTYPNDLLSSTNIYGGNYVVFYINALEDSTLFDGSSAANSINTSASPRDFSNADGVAAGAVEATIRGAVGLQAGGIAAAGLQSNGVNKVVATVGGAGVGILAGEAFIRTVGGAKQEYKRMNTAIALYIPGEVSVRYSTTWEQSDMATSMAFAEFGQGLFDANSSAIDAAAGYLSGLALKSPIGGDFISKVTKTAANPKKEQLFREVDFRTFSFNYEFYPRSAEEARNIQNIINEFKFHMHPEFKKDTNQFLYTYPSQFDISYYNNGVENLNLHRHVSCALTDISINYTPNAVFTTFDDGMPSQIKMVLTFKELSLLTKDRIREGF